ncbi:MAG: DUF1836 domain-containing protein [Erysipelotrichaceae bacterium]|nr:DUF1836 domain-containing protein [Erysipelotrichaceae bacterium]
MNKEFEKWTDEMIDFHLPRWDELPDVDLYKDQIITLVERYLSPLNIKTDTLITPSIINNYVKLNVVPKPNKKKQYSRVHLAYFIVVSALKQIMNINDVKFGIEYETSLHTEEEAYNRFADALEKSLSEICTRLNKKEEVSYLKDTDIGMSLSCNALASMLVSKNYFRFEKNDRKPDE